LIQKKKDLRLSRPWKLVRNRGPYSEPKAYFPTLPCGNAWLVYLTWTTLFVSAGIYTEKRGSTRLHTFHRGGAELRSTPYSARSNSVDCHFEISLKVTVSLYTM
jgi:hypothetical protein